jgi:hypothetical protein
MGLGCLLGLMPLLFIDTEANHDHARQLKLQRKEQAGAA